MKRMKYSYSQTMDPTIVGALIAAVPLGIGGLFTYVVNQKQLSQKSDREAIMHYLARTRDIWEEWAHQDIPIAEQLTDQHLATVLNSPELKSLLVNQIGIKANAQNALIRELELLYVALEDKQLSKKAASFMKEAENRAKDSNTTMAKLLDFTSAYAKAYHYNKSRYDEALSSPFDAAYHKNRDELKDLAATQLRKGLTDWIIGKVPGRKRSR